MSVHNEHNKYDVKCYVVIINYSPLKTKGLMQVIKGKNNVLSNLLAQKWPPMVSDSVLYAELKL